MARQLAGIAIKIGVPAPPPARARDWCAASPVVYLVGHNYGPFTPLLGAHVGDLVRYWDASGVPTTYHITGITRVPSSALPPYMTDASHPHLVMQTCAVPDG